MKLSRPFLIINKANLGKLRWYNLIAALLGVCLTAGIGMSQIRSSTITGIVTDVSGALVPNATVMVRNELTNITHQSKTNGAGEYTVPYLPEGRYSVTFTAEGFQTYVKAGIVLETATTMRVDAALVIGTVSTTVEVQANAVALQTENGTVHGTVNKQIIDSIPDINRNPLLYAGLVAGVVPDAETKSSTALGVGHGDREGLSAVRINGAILGSNDILLDGVSVQGAGWHEMAVMPDTDALQEVRVTTNSFSAETGDAQGVIAMTTKSGANLFHGDLYYYLRNEALDAAGMYNDLYGIKKPVYRLNQGGGSIGGPVIIPHLYNGKDKMFFFVNFMRLAHSDPANLVTTVPTDLQRQGNFSQTLVPGISGQPEHINLYNPFLATPYSGSSTVVQRQIYAGAILPAAGSGPGSMDPYGQKLLEAYPEPNATPTDAFGDNNYRFVGTTPEDRNAFAARYDYRLGQKNSLYATGGFSIGSDTPPNLWGNSNQFTNIQPQSVGIVKDHDPYGSIGDVYTVNPTTVIDIRYGFTRVHGLSGIPNRGWTAADYTQYGMPANVMPLISAFGQSMSVGDGSWDWGGPIAMLNLDSWTHKDEHQNNHDIVGNLTKVAGRWTFKAGGEYRVYLSNWQDLEQSTPVLNTAAAGNAGASTAQYANISGTGSSLNIDPANQGLPFVDLLTGVAGFHLDPGCGTVLALAAKYFALYSQNDWKVTNKLTVNLGVRWEVQPGPTERFNRLADINMNAPSPFTAASDLNPLGGLGLIGFAAKDGQPRNMWNTEWGDFSPRLGAAYQINHDTVLRGGYGRSFYASNTGFNANGLIYGQVPFSGGAEAIPYGLSPSGVPVGTFDQSTEHAGVRRIGGGSITLHLRKRPGRVLRLVPTEPPERPC